MLFGALLGVLLFTVVLAAAPVAAQSRQDFSERGEWMMDMMLGSRHEDFDKELETRYGAEFLDRMHESMGQMAFRGGMMGGGFAPAGMMGMMGGWGGSVGSLAAFGWLWGLVGAVDSVLLGVLLLVLIRRFLK